MVNLPSEVIAILREFKKRNPHIVGYSTKMQKKIVGGVERDIECIRIYVRKKLPESSLHPSLIIPKTIHDIQTDVVEIGHIRALSSAPFQDPKGRYRPIFAGISVGSVNVTAGAIGFFAKDKDGNYYVCSNNHVLANSNRDAIGTAIVQPGCYSEDTRVFTKRGLIYFYEVLDDDEVLTFNLDSGELEWQKPLKRHKYRYTGSLVHFNGQMYDLLVTPNHNMIVRRRGGKWFLVTAEEILQRQFKNKVQELERARDLIVKGYGCKRLSREFGKSVQWAQELIKRVKYGLLLIKKGIAHTTLELPKTGIWRGSDFSKFSIGDCHIPIDEWLQFLGFWLAEGSIYKKRGYLILLRNFDYTKLQHMAQLLKKWGFRPYISKYGQLGFYSKQLCLWLSKNCFTMPYDSLPKGRKAYYKCLPSAFKELPPERLKVLLTWMFKGDGTFEKGLLRRYITSSKRLAEDVIEIALKCGYAVSMRNIKARRIYVIGISNRNITPRITKQPRTVHYDGYVYCLTVPNHAMVVERNGKISICGNSYDLGKDPQDRIALLSYFEPIKFNTCPVSSTLTRILNGVAKTLGRKSRFFYATEATNLVDLAAGKLSVDHINQRNGTIPYSGIKTEYHEGDIIIKSGRTTGVTEGPVFDTQATVTVSYEYAEATFEDQIVVNKPGTSSGGDSGSGASTLDGAFYGLLFAGSDTSTIFNKSVHVINTLAKWGLEFEIAG